MAGLFHDTFLGCPGMSLSMLVGFVAILDQTIQPFLGVLWFLGFYNQKKQDVTFFLTLNIFCKMSWLNDWPDSQCNILPTLGWFDWLRLGRGWKMDENCSSSQCDNAKTCQNQKAPNDAFRHPGKILEICHQPTSGSVPPIKGGMPSKKCANSGSWILSNSGVGVRCEHEFF